MNYFSLIKDALTEKNVTILDLEKASVIKKNIFYEFKFCCPSLSNLINIANYLNMSIDYILEFCNENNFHKYKQNQKAIYPKICEMLKTMKISQVKFCKDLGISRTNFSRWNHGSQPKLSTLIEISKYFNCMIDDLLETE